ncbi:MAG: chorion class high-cysteine HCB protein 13 [Lachnospiraceae bacterium]|nr:chorion class high-cysteine HCB protein 13 [Lachnospiraceae bacterium]
MSDLSATNCGCNNGYNNSCNGNNWIWILLLLSCCGGNGNGLLGTNSGCGCNGNNNSCCDWIIWILLLSTFCGGNNGGCGCGCN